MVRESERRYDTQDYLALPSLSDMPGTVVAEPDEQVRDARYLDTEYFDPAAGLDLACAHKAVRHRGMGWTLRLPVAEDSRDEVGAPRKKPTPSAR